MKDPTFNHFQQFFLVVGLGLVVAIWLTFLIEVVMWVIR